jgi:elongation factor P
MISASQIRAGMAIRYEDQLYKVLAADYHPGQGKMGGVNHLRLENLHTGTTWEHSLRADLKVAEAPVERQTLEYLYSDDSACFFMHPVSYQQTDIPNTLLGERVKFLEPGMQVPVEFVDRCPVSVVFPDFVEVKIADTGPPTHGQVESTWKAARLSNGVQVMVPPFVKTGDAIRLSLSDLRYMDRAKAKGR